MAVVSWSLLLPRSCLSSVSHVVLFRKWGGLIVMFLISFWWTIQLELHTTISDFHMNHNLHPAQRLATTTTTTFDSADIADSSPTIDIVDSSLESQHQGLVDGVDPSSLKKQQRHQRHQQRIHDEEEKQHQQHSHGDDDGKNGEKKRTLRENFEESYDPNDWQRIRQVVDSLRVDMPRTPQIDAYDIFHCPSNGPPLDYPYHWPLRKILANWNPAHVEMPEQLIYQSLCIFDWDKDYDAIVKYRQAEVPFIVQNQPDLLKASERWMTGQIHLKMNPASASSGGGGADGFGTRKQKSYLEKLIGKHKQTAEHSDSNKFTYWKSTAETQRDLTWKPPTEEISLSYRAWYQRAMDLDQKVASSSTANSSHDSGSQASLDHWYFHVNAKGDKENHFLYDELPIFRPDQEYRDAHPQNHVFMVEPEHSRGINCRFGMRGVLAAAHYDSQRNWVILMGGQRRYILAHPRECAHLHLYPQGHSSGRHSSVDWTNVTSYDENDHADETILQQARATEVVLQAAHALYLPSFWFHFIVSLNINYQCNARSGRSYIDSDPIANCGFTVPAYEEEL